MRNKSVNIEIKGLVQGVGFRPFVYRLAKKYNIKGWVKNNNTGVSICAEGNKIDDFIKSISKLKPANSIIENINVIKNVYQGYDNFIILKSDVSTEEITRVSPDIAVCDECLEDMKNQQHRINYPFINCTNCGPRFTIIKDIPYDRVKTSMSDFEMCNICKSEYSDINDRRFHAEPIACNNCGPVYNLKTESYQIDKIDEIINKLCEIIGQGGIAAFKSLGGFNFICDAFNDSAVKKMRELKKRDGKPFAVMFKNLSTASKFVYINKFEKDIIESWRKPIVILKEKKIVSYNINIGIKTIGVLLPYMPLHYLLFEKLKTKALVFTSGNFAGEPIIISNNEALEKTLNLTDAVVINNREIINRTDDSVVQIINETARIIRRSRGYAPTPIDLKINVDGILACGGELKNTFCFGKDNKAYISQHIGDLTNPETYNFFLETIGKFEKLLRVKPDIIACDLHPDYLSTGYALQSGIKVIRVQHHHAHIASCMAENNLDEKVIGVSFDGTGYGDDGTVWGGEFLICDLADYNRVYHLGNTILPGGDAAIKEPWRMAVSYLYSIYGDDFLNMNIPLMSAIDSEKIKLLVSAIKKNINCFITSSAGRLFDAVSALLGISLYNSFEAEASIRLENIINEKTKNIYEVDFDKKNITNSIIRNVIDDMDKKIDLGIISAKFHNTIVMLILKTCIKLKSEFDINKTVLSGGVFQNKYLLENTEKALKKSGFFVYSNKIVPTNDGGLSLGQLAIAAKRRSSGCV